MPARVRLNCLQQICLSLYISDNIFALQITGLCPQITIFSIPDTHFSLFRYTKIGGVGTAGADAAGVGTPGASERWPPWEYRSKSNFFGLAAAEENVFVGLVLWKQSY